MSLIISGSAFVYFFYVFDCVNYAYIASNDQHLSNMGGRFICKRLHIDHKMRFYFLKSADSLFIISVFIQQGARSFSDKYR